MCLQEAVEVLPGLGYPVDDLNQVVAARVFIDLCLDQLSPKEAAQEALDWLGVIRAQHPPEAKPIVSGATKTARLSLTLTFKVNLSVIILTLSIIMDRVINIYNTVTLLSMLYIYAFLTAQIAKQT